MKKVIETLLITILVFSIAAIPAMAFHASTVTIDPSTWAVGTEKDVTLTVRNNEGSNIVEVELLVPETAEEEPLYLIEEISRPAGWTYKFRSRVGVGEANPYKITWSTSGAGIASGNSLELEFTAKSPEVGGTYEWSWRTTDINDESYAGILETRTSLAPVDHFEITNEPISIEADESFKISVSVRDENDKVKTDYIGTIKLSSTDVKAILPKDYTFKTEDRGSKEFVIRYRTSGNQTTIITDEGAGVSETSDETRVRHAEPISIKISPSGVTIAAEKSVSFTTMAKDKFENQFEVTEDTYWDIDNEAKGNWTENEYTTEEEGVWIVTGTYRTDGKDLIDSVRLDVGLVEEEEPSVTSIIEPLMITSLDFITVAPGSNDTMILSVDNFGDEELTGVTVLPEGIPSDWVEVFPSSINIEGRGSKSLLITIAVPENESGSREIRFTVNTVEGFTTTKNVTLNIGTPITGMLISVENLLPLGIVVIVVAIVIIAVWRAWFSKPKQKS